MKAVVLAAGLGKRMRPLTFTRPKFLLPVAGKPALDRVLELLIDAFDEVGMVVGYGKEQIMERYGDGSSLGLKITYFHQQQLLGTAQAVSLVREWVGKEDFLVINGDTLTDEASIRRLLDLHAEKASSPDFGGCLAISEVEDASQYGVVFLEGERVVGVEEKPKVCEVKTVNA
ncbi:MAG: nucleotidyltransferase family protein, partial [Candidatus Hadarchaeales archaeon]